MLMFTIEINDNTRLADHHVQSKSSLPHSVMINRNVMSAKTTYRKANNAYQMSAIRQCQEGKQPCEVFIPLESFRQGFGIGPFDCRSDEMVEIHNSDTQYHGSLRCISARRLYLRCAVILERSSIDG